LRLCGLREEDGLRLAETGDITAIRKPSSTRNPQSAICNPY